MKQSLELFAGAGGLAQGLALAGFAHLGLVELNKAACVTLRQNFPAHLVYAGDVRAFDPLTVGGGERGTLDLMAGGPPCQPFSLGGKHQAHTDERDMFPQAIRYVEQLQPKAFIFENVKGLLRQSFRRYFDYILLRLSYPECTVQARETWEEHLLRLQQINPDSYQGVIYDVSYQLVNAADFGVPQKRERVFIVGLRRDLGITWQFPTPTHSETRLLWDKYVTGSYWQRHHLEVQSNLVIRQKLLQDYGLFAPVEKPWQTVRDALAHLPHPDTAHPITDHLFRLGARTYPGHTGSAIDEPAKTIKAGDHGVPGGENMLRYADGSVRYFTVHEAKLLQTFAENFVITGAWSEAMRQIGNAVPVKLAQMMGERLYQALSAVKSQLPTSLITHHKHTLQSLIPPAHGNVAPLSCIRTT